MYQLSKEQVKMFVRVLMPMLYSMNDVAGIYDELDSKKPVEEQHQRRRDHDSPRIAYLREKAAMAGSEIKSSDEAEDGKSGKEVEYEGDENRSQLC